jgi:hypothetical protein
MGILRCVYIFMAKRYRSNSQLLQHDSNTRSCCNLRDSRISSEGSSRAEDRTTTDATCVGPFSRRRNGCQLVFIELLHVLDPVRSCQWVRNRGWYIRCSNDSLVVFSSCAGSSHGLDNDGNGSRSARIWISFYVHCESQ